MSGERQRPDPVPERLARAIPAPPHFEDQEHAETGEEDLSQGRTRGEERDGTGRRGGGRDDPRFHGEGAGPGHAGAGAGVETGLVPIEPGSGGTSLSGPGAERGGAGALALARRLTRRSGSNFYYAFLVLPKGKREAIYAVYALARAVDDAVDEAPNPQAARQRLALWEEEVARLESGTPSHPILQAVARARERFPIPLRSIGALLEGARMDINQRRYESFAELRDYCENVASAIGHMCIEIFGYRSPRTREYATNLGIALQLTNILRDLGQDSRRGRLYLPLEDLRRFGAREEDLHAGRRTREVMELLAFEAKRARTFYGDAEAALDPCDRRAMMSAEIMRRIYRALLVAIEASSFDVFDRQIRLSRPRKAALALATYLRLSLASTPPPAGP